jgi:hypothetical protein
MIKDGILIVEDVIGVLGCRPNTDIHVRTIIANGGEKFLKVRVGFDLFGMSNNHNGVTNPFDEEYHDNYHEIVVKTEEEIIPRLKEKFKEVGDSLWE